ncbi:hypothetical protein [Candidatus Vidania fulgoroideorum]
MFENFILKFYFFYHYIKNYFNYLNIFFQTINYFKNFVVKNLYY